MTPAELAAYWASRGGPPRDSWREQGRLLGYPECCIEDFCSRETWPAPEPQCEAGNRTGFIPCGRCAAEVLAGRPLHTLIQNRAEPLPFPLAHQPTRGGA